MFNRLPASTTWSKVLDGAFVTWHLNVRSKGVESVSDAQLRSKSKLQMRYPWCVTTLPSGKSIWMYQDSFYEEDEGLNPDDVAALAKAAELRFERKLNHAKNIASASAWQEGSKREHIPIDVRNLVWQRDGGACCECSSSRDLQFDHIIPVALGGGSNPENLQILCGDCNRRKGATLG